MTNTSENLLFGMIIVVFFLKKIEILSEKNVLHQRRDFNNLEELKTLYKNIEKYFNCEK